MWRTEAAECSRVEMGSAVRAVLYMWACCLSPYSFWVSLGNRSLLLQMFPCQAVVFLHSVESTESRPCAHPTVLYVLELHLFFSSHLLGVVAGRVSGWDDAKADEVRRGEVMSNCESLPSGWSWVLGRIREQQCSIWIISLVLRHKMNLSFSLSVKASRGYITKSVLEKCIYFFLK